MYAINFAPQFDTIMSAIGDALNRDASDVENAFWTILVGLACNTSCAIVGCFLVLRRMSLLGDAISHAVLAGIGIAYLVTGSVAFFPMFVGALVVGLLTAMLTHSLKSWAQVPEDAGLGVVFTSFFAIGVVVISQFRMHLDASCVLFGTYEFVALDASEMFGLYVPDTLPRLCFALLATVAIVWLFWKELKLASFDPALATAMGFSAGVIHYLLMGLVASVTVASLEAVGAIVVIAMLIVPAATAQMLTDRLSRMIQIAVISGAVSAVVGYLLALRWQTSAAGMMAVVSGGQLGLAVFLSPRYGLVSRAWYRLRLQLRIVSEDVIAMLYRDEERQSGAASRSATATWRQCVAYAGGGLLGWLSIPLMRRHGELAMAGRDRLELTDKGRRRGQSLVRSHRLWESYLDKHFDLPPDHLHEPAERIEHYIGPELQERLSNAVSDQQTDPHGQSIPPRDPNGTGVEGR